MNATEIKFYVPLKSGGHTVIVVELFQKGAAAPFIRSLADGDSGHAIACGVQSLHDAVCCIRTMLERVTEVHGRLDYQNGTGKEDAIHAAAMVVFLAMQTTPAQRVVRP